jgi:hypothetical protein
MLLANMHRPFVSREFAQRLALLVIEETYPADVFAAGGPGTTLDKGDEWWVTFDNLLPHPEGSIIPRQLRIEIRKSNGEILSIS